MRIGDEVPCPKGLTTTTQEHFPPPKLKKPTVTRAKLYEKFLWQELYDEYIRVNLRERKVALEKPITEYESEFGREMSKTNVAIKNELIKKYPLYYTPAITLWNHDGDTKKDFKVRYSITKPLHLQSEKFGI